MTRPYSNDLRERVVTAVRSLNLDPKDLFIQKYGGAFPVNSLPEGLQALQSGKTGHFVVAPATPMTFETYQGLLNRIELGNFNVLP